MMKLFTEVVNEAKQYQDGIVTPAEMAEYISKMSRKMPKDMQVILMYLQKYNILDKEEVLYIMGASKSNLKQKASMLHMPLAEMEDLQKLLKNMDMCDLQMLPMFQSEEDRKSLEDGTKNLDDVTLDLDTDKGRNDVAKKYMPLVTAIANKYVGKSPLGKNELLSAGQLGLMQAINTYRRPDNRIDVDDKIKDKEEAKKQKRLTFKQYAGWCIRNSILYDMNYLSRVVKTSQYQYEKNRAEGSMERNFEVSLDAKFGGDEGEDMLSKIADITTSDSRSKTNPEKQWDSIFKELEKKFNTRSLNMFYKYFGLNGAKKMKGQDIAKEFGVTSSRVSGIIKNIVSYLKDNPRTKAMLAELVNVYAESLLVDNFGKDKEEIMEALANDDVYLMLEDATRWSNPEVVKAALMNAFNQFDKESVNFVKNCISEGFDYLDAHFKRHRKMIVRFLEIMYPTESFERKSDVYLLDKMMEIMDAANKLKL